MGVEGGGGLDEEGLGCGRVVVLGGLVGEGEVVGLEVGFWVWLLVRSLRVGMVGEVGEALVPRSLGLVEDVRRGMRVERDGRRRRVVQNMVG